MWILQTMRHIHARYFPQLEPLERKKDKRAKKKTYYINANEPVSEMMNGNGSYQQPGEEEKNGKPRRRRQMIRKTQCKVHHRSSAAMDGTSTNAFTENALIRSHVQIYSLKNAPVPNVCAEWEIEGWGFCQIGKDVRHRNRKGRKREKKDEMMCRMCCACGWGQNLHTPPPEIRFS
jgi:hypothetical protein